MSFAESIASLADSSNTYSLLIISINTLDIVRKRIWMYNIIKYQYRLPLTLATTCCTALVHLAGIARQFLAMIFNNCPHCAASSACAALRRVEVRKWRSFAVDVAIAAAAVCFWLCRGGLVAVDAGTKRVKRQLSVVIWPASVQRSARQRQSEN